MCVLVAGGTGATGKLLVKQLLDRGQKVRVIVRSVDRLPEEIRGNQNLTVIEASLLDLSDKQLQHHIADCSAIASCLGHNISFKGIYGKPRRLVSEAVKRFCEAVRKNGPDGSVKFVLMNTAGNSNRDLDEKISFSQRLLIGLIRLLLPPHPDNEQAAEYLRTGIGQNDSDIEWVVVRPDTLLDEDMVSKYELHASPTRSALFNPGKTSRINVAHFMAELITEDKIWSTWKGQMPIIYNREQ